MLKTNKKKKQNRRSEKFTRQLHFLKSCCNNIGFIVKACWSDYMNIDDRKKCLFCQCYVSI